MKIEHLLVQHFYQQREITLQGLGKFTLAPDFIVPADNDKEVQMPEHAVNFQYDPKAGEDEALISFIVQQSRKIRPLASADLDSYLVLGKQFLNIGKPFVIEGLGVLEKSQQGDYVFRQGAYHQSKQENAPELKEKAEDDISFAAKKPKRSGSRRPLLMILIFLLIALGASSIWYYLHRQSENENPAREQEPVMVVMPDSNQIRAAIQDSLRRDSLLHPPKPQYTFRVVVKELSNKDSAIKKMNDFTANGHTIIMYTTDSVLYKLYEPYNRPLADTTMVMDSLKRNFRFKKVYIELF